MPKFLVGYTSVPTIFRGAPWGDNSEQPKKKPRGVGHGLSDICLAENSQTADLLGNTILQNNGYHI